MDIPALRVFLAVAEERSFSRAAVRLFRTQSAVSQAVRRLEAVLDEALFDRTTREARLTEAGRTLKDYAERVLNVAEEAERAVKDLKDMKRGRVVIGANESGVEVLIPLIARFRDTHPGVEFEVKRSPSRLLGVEVLGAALDFGVVTFVPSEKGLRTVVLASDELVVLSHPKHPFAKQSRVTLEEFGRATVIAHSDPSPARERVLRKYAERGVALNIKVSLPSLDGVKRAVERGIGVALLPRRTALSEIEAGRLAATTLPELRRPRDLRLLYRAAGNFGNSAHAFLDMVKAARA
ncbi:MAG TPA: LysR substrate-binding domain-containing protein [Thermoanaerobaculia bacterium]|nr:LysR substrate-binding domain-containing protein [Thermoanaerobaculia bacterium]